MNTLLEFFAEIIFKKMIVGIFGFYTLLFFYRILRNKEKADLLKRHSQNDYQNFKQAFLLNVVGLISFTLFFVAFVSVFF